MYNKILIIFLTSTLLSFAQFSYDEKIEVNDNSFIANIHIPTVKYKDIPKGKFTIRDYLDFEDYSKPGSCKLPEFHYVFAIPPYSHPEITIVSKTENFIKNTVPAFNRNVKLLDDSTLTEVKAETEKLTDTSNLPDFEIEGYFWYRDFYCMEIKINSHKYDLNGNGIREIKEIKLKFEFPEKTGFIKNVREEFSYDKHFRATLQKLFYNYKIAEQFKSEMPKDLLPDTTYQWINFNAEYVKFAVGSDDIFRIYGYNLTEAGYDITSVNPANFRLFESGHELPVIVNDGDDGIFDSNDYIEFWGHKNYPALSYRATNNSNEEYREYLNRYTDSTYYFLTWENGNGVRTLKQNEFRQNLTDTLTYYSELVHKEVNSWYQNVNGNETENQMPNWLKNKTWYWGWMGYWSPVKKLHFAVSDLVEGKTGKAFFKATAAGLTNYMRFKLLVNDIQLDSQRVSKFHQVLLNGEFASDILQNGDNVLKAVCFADDGNFAAYDWFDVEYPKMLKLRNDSLYFTIHDDVTSGEYLLSLRNASDTAYVIYKISPRLKKITNFVVENNTLFFSDTINAGDKYFIISENLVKSPNTLQPKTFVNLRDSQNQAEYIAVTHPKFDNAVDNYLNYISSEYDITVKRVDVTDIFDEFSFGYPYPEALRLFFYDAYVLWQEPKIAYVTLIGDASYDYKYTVYANAGVKLSVNYVPSYGKPVGDYWYVVWDETTYPIPQLKLGRLPILTEEELDYYLSKLEADNEFPYTDWNKRYLFFSGGDTRNGASEINMFRTANNEIINNYVKPKPLAGKYMHFYKTLDPPSDFGPYTQEEINRAIKNGSVFIAYLGHSGTATWDNGINSIIQLQNDVGRFPVITDFGCSTNKFAEPDIVCFGESFIFNPDGQALGYLGNSSLGFTSTAKNSSKIFYENLITDSLHEVGVAHLNTKIDLFQRYGNSAVNKIFAYANTFLGEPLIRTKIPSKPNFVVNNSSLLEHQTLNENLDSVEIKVVVNNFGLSYDDSVKIVITENYLGENISQAFLSLPYPDYRDTLSVYLHTKNNPGVHKLTIDIDPENLIDEIYEDDNRFIFELNVYSMALRDLIPYEITNGGINTLVILNPTTLNNNVITKINLQIADNDEFTDCITNIVPVNDFYTKVDLADFNLEERYWIRYKSEDTKDFSNPKSFLSTNNFKYSVGDSLSFAIQKMNNLELANDRMKISLDSSNISVLSAGAYSGATVIIAKNGENLLSNTFFAGMGIAVFDSLTMAVDTAFWYELFQHPENVEALANYIYGIENGKIVAMGVANDARNNISNDLRNAIKTLGSTKIDSLVFQGPWALIGRKGAPPGDVIEEVLGPYDGQIYIDTTFVRNNTFGTLTTSLIGPASNWESFSVSDSLPGDSEIKYRILGERSAGAYDTLDYLMLNDGLADLSFLNDSAYSKIKILAEFSASSEFVSPVLKSLGVNYRGFAELGTNYQVVSVDRDSVDQGETVNLSFSVYNAGEIPADSFQVVVDLVEPNNTSTEIFSETVGGLANDEKKDFDVAFNTALYGGEGRFKITIDKNNNVREYYKDNNYYTVPFYVFADTSRPQLELTIDGRDILDWEYISNKPTIKITLSDDFPLPITDTSSVIITLNGKRVYYSDPAREDVISDENPKYVVTYTPELETGEYTLYVNGMDANGNPALENGIEKHFKVSTKAELLEVYNYPNPFENDTYFTFKLTQIPDEMKIRIFTVAGRLIKEISLSPSDLNYDFNRIYWDGRDEDGDVLANGVYFYKVVLKKGDETVTKIQKLAVMR